MRELIMEKEALVVCSDKSIGIGITVWDIETGTQLLRIPTCASPSHGLLCLRNRYLVASQIHKPGSVGGGAIFAWASNKPLPPLRNYTLEPIGPVSCTKNGIYLAGGALTGNVYIWEVTNGKLLKTWAAHSKSVNCLLFSDDDSLLISGSDDGVICVWSLVSLLDEEDSGCFPSLLHYSSEHSSTITCLLTTSDSVRSLLVSSALDGTCKVWDFASGKLLQTQSHPFPVTAIAIHQNEGRLLFCGSTYGAIFVKKLHIGLEDDPSIIVQDQQVELKGHIGSITALTSCQSGIVSASEDYTICIWDVISFSVLRRLNHCKGVVTNLVVVPRSSFSSTLNQKRVLNHYNVSPLGKYPQKVNSSDSSATRLSLCHSHEGKKALMDFQSTCSLSQHISHMENKHSQMTVQMKMESFIESRSRVVNMAKHVMEINKHLQSQLLDLVECRLFWSTRIGRPKAREKKEHRPGSLQQEKESTHTANSYSAFEDRSPEFA